MLNNIPGYAAAIACLLASCATAWGQVTTRPTNIGKQATIGAYAVNLKTGKTLWAYNEDAWLTPASVTKLLTTGAALRTMGPNAQFETSFELSKDTAGVWVLGARGDFDPTQDSKYFNSKSLNKAIANLADTLRRRGVTHISSFVIDDTRISDEVGCPRHLWEDMGNYYGARPSVVCTDDNLTTLYFSSPAQVGKPCKLDSISPKADGMWPKTNVMTHSLNKDKCMVYYGGGTTWYANGCIPTNRKAFKVRSVMPDPEKAYARKVASLLRENGIEVDTAKIDKAQPGERIYTIKSPTLTEIVRQTNHKSINLCADALAFHMAMRETEGAVTWDDAAAAVSGFWKSTCGLDMSIYDGSGISPFGAVSAKTFVSMIKDMRQSSAWTPFRESLPVFGKSGTVAGLGRGTDIEGNARAKSGTMTAVVAYAGIMENKNKEEIVFCIIVNHFTEHESVVRTQIVNWLNKIYSANNN